MKLDPKEKEIVHSVERGEWRSIPGWKGERKRYGRNAAATFRKDQRVKIRISSKISMPPEACVGGGPALSDTHLEPSPQVCVGTSAECLIRRCSLSTVAYRPL